jgi:hypothetical protein
VDWLSGTVQRWVALLATVAGIVTFAATKHVAWAWVAIGALLLLVASFAWTARDEHGKRLAAEGTPDLDRLISDGHAIKEGARWDEWPVWRQRANSRLRAQFGKPEAREFSRLGEVIGPAERVEAIERQVSYLEGLRER